jgi:hypothetical protein
MADDEMWVFFDQPEERRSLDYWRDYVGSKPGADRGAVERLSPALLLYVGNKLREACNTGKGAGEYKSLLRAVGGAGDSDWYDAKAEMAAAAVSQQLILDSLPELAAGEFGSSRKPFAYWLAEHRENYEFQRGEP